MARFDDPEDFFRIWRDVLDSRAKDAFAALSKVPGVAGLILAGSMGRNEPWPLSDIDVIPIYVPCQARIAADALSSRALELEAKWKSEGMTTGLDLGKIWFTEKEVFDAVTKSPEQTVALLDDFRWYHGIDKPYGGRAAWDPTGVAASFLDWVNRTRFTGEIVSALRRQLGRVLSEAVDQAADRLKHRELQGTAMALHRAGHSMIGYMLEGRGVRGASFGRIGTRFEQVMTESAAADIAGKVMEVLGLAPQNVQLRMASAPEDVQRWHSMSFRARQIVGEEVTHEQDARDVLLSFTTYAFRYDKQPFASWTGADEDVGSLTSRLGLAEELRSTIPEQGL